MFAGAIAAGLAHRAEARRPPTNLFVWLILQQFRTDYLDLAGGRLAAGGFRRLLSEGAFFAECRCSASTFTSSGLASLITGTYPEMHGLVGERWFDRHARSVVEARAEEMLADGLGEQPGNRRLFVYGSTAQHARMLARRAHQMVAGNGNGGVEAVGEGPGWLEVFNQLHPVENIRNARWMAFGAGAGAPPLRVLRYDAAHPEEFHYLFTSSPFAQAVEFDFLRTWLARERMGQTGDSDCLIATLNSTAALGYDVGADSPLMLEMVLHLDREIEATLEALNRSPGPGNYTLVVSAAHGAPRAPENPGTMEVPGETVARAVDAALSRRFDTAAGRNSYVARYVYPFLYLTPEALRRDPSAVRSEAAAAAMALPQVAGYYTADRRCSHTGEWERRFRNSFHAARSGDVMLAYRPGYVEQYGTGRGVSYGSLYNYDARVPLFLYGPQFRAQTFENRVEIIDVAPTLARAMGAPPPASSTGRVLGESFAETPRQRR